MKDLAKIKVGIKTHVKPSDIYYLEANENYTIVHMYDGQQILMSTTMGIVAEQLEPFGFCRAHRKYVVNLKYLKKLSFPQLVLKKDQTLPISRRRKITVERFYKKWQQSLI